MTINLGKDNQYYLATTALHDFWDLSKPILFVGEGCKRFSQKNIWGKCDHKVVNGPWCNYEEIEKAYSYVNNVYEYLLPLIAHELNRIHSVNHSMRYWKIVVGPWLIKYVNVIYDRYSNIKGVQNNYPNFTTTLLDEKSYITPTDLFDFLDLIYNDFYNLQIYSRILVALGSNFPRKTYDNFINTKKFAQLSVGAIVKSNLRKFVHKLIQMTILKKCKIILDEAYFQKFDLFKILMRTYGGVCANFTTQFHLTSKPTDDEARNSLYDLSLSRNNEFEKILISFLPLDIPECYVEGYKEIGNAVKKNYNVNPQVIISANGWHYNTIFNRWAATSSENGSKLIGIQHGGDYGSFQIHMHESHELAITDRFYSWGWNQKDSTSNIFPMCATYLVNRKPIGADSKKSGILFVTTVFPRYVFRFPVTTEQMVHYIWLQERFYNALSPENKEKLKVRMLRHDHGWDYIDRWKSIDSKIKIESELDQPFTKSLTECRLYVCDHLGTTFLEALAANKPTVLFWDPEVNQVRMDAKPYYDKLRAVGILFNDPEEAAIAVNSVYDDVESWWNDAERQETRLIFCEHFARTSHKAINEWLNELRSIYKNDKLSKCQTKDLRVGFQ